MCYAACTLLFVVVDVCLLFSEKFCLSQCISTFTFFQDVTSVSLYIYVQVHWNSSSININPINLERW